MLTGPTKAPPANGMNYASWFIVGFIFRTYLFYYFSCKKISFHLLVLLGLFVESGLEMLSFLAKQVCRAQAEPEIYSHTNRG